MKQVEVFLPERAESPDSKNVFFGTQNYAIDEPAAPFLGSLQESPAFKRCSSTKSPPKLNENGDNLNEGLGMINIQTPVGTTKHDE